MCMESNDLTKLFAFGGKQVTDRQAGGFLVEQEAKKVVSLYQPESADVYNCMLPHLF